MEKEDARFQTLEQLHERRKQVVRLHKKGIKVMQIVGMTGLSYPTVRGAIDLFDAGGWAAVRPAVRGRNRGDGRVLSEAQEKTVQRMIIDQRPEQLKMDFSLWSRAAVGQLIEQEFGIKLQVRSVGKYLARWGFTPQKPIKRAYEQSPAAVQAWLEAEYPAIEQRARVEGAEIHWGDETALVNTDVRGRSFAPMGKTPVAMAIGGTRQKLSMPHEDATPEQTAASGPLFETVTPRNDLHAISPAAGIILRQALVKLEKARQLLDHVSRKAA